MGVAKYIKYFLTGIILQVPADTDSDAPLLHVFGTENTSFGPPKGSV